MVPVELLAISANDLLEPGEEKAKDTLWCSLLQAIDTNSTFVKEIQDNVKQGDPIGEDGKIWVPNKKDLRRRILELYHDSPLTGHLGIQGTFELVAWAYTWEGMHNYVKKYMQGCATCSRAKKRNYKLHRVLRPLPIPEGPWQWTESDHIVKLPKSKGYDSIYVVVDRFTKMAHFIPMTEAKNMEEDLIDLHLKHV
jgi:hypothetical protein